MKKILYIALALLSLCACRHKEPQVQLLPSEERGYPLVSGHRGANCIAPENTMASADSCIRYGIDVMETDVTVSKDGVFYLLHDNTLKRTTNGTGYPGEHDSEYLDKLDAGSWMGEQWAGQHLLRFQDLLRKAHDNGLEVTVDYRRGDFKEMVDLIESEKMLEHTYFTFSSEKDMGRFREMYPDIKTLQAYVKTLDDLDRVIEEFHPNIIVNWIDRLTPEFVEICHAQRLQVLALCLGLDDQTANNQKAVDLHVDVVATDRPEQFRKQFDYDGLGL